MKKIVLILSAVLLTGSGLGCQTPASGPGNLTQVRPQSAEGKSLTEAINALDQAIANLEKSAEGFQRKPALVREQTYSFDLTGAPSLGPQNAKYTMVVFDDFECPFCEKFAESSKKILAKYPDEIRLVFMNFPLHKDCNPTMATPMHPRACFAAEAAMAAAEQGKFWEMYDYIFANRRSFTQESLVSFAQSQGLDAAKIQEAIQTEKYKTLLASQAQQLIPTGARGTPSVFINGQTVRNIRWDVPDMAVEQVGELLHPKPALEKPALAKAVDNPAALPAAAVILDDGARLEDRLAEFQKRLEGIELPGARKPPVQEGPDPNKVFSFRTENSPSLGPQSAPVTFVLFCDLLSPHCQLMEELVKDLRKTYPDQVRLVFKSNPNTAMHPNTLPAHEAAMEALAQGKFWEMQDLILQNRDKITPELLRQLAQQVGLNLDKYDLALKSQMHRPLIASDFAEAREAQLAGTSGLFLNGKFLKSPTKESLAAAVAQILGAKPQ